MNVAVAPVAGADNETTEAPFKEARRRHRNRRLVAGMAVLTLAVTGVVAHGLVGHPPIRHPPGIHVQVHGAPPAVPEPSVAVAAPCLADQLDIEFEGTQGGAGNWFAAFWIADTSPSACALPMQVTAQFLDAQGAVHDSATLAAAGELTLSARATLPPPGHDPGAGEMLAALVLGWPTEADAALEMGSTGAVCPVPPFTPVSVRVQFEGQEPITISDLGAHGGIGSICGPITQRYLESLSGPQPASPVPPR